MKLADYASTAQSNLRRSKLRTFLTIIAIVIGAFTFALSLGLGEGVRNYVNSQIGRYQDANLYSVDKAAGGPGANLFSVETPEAYDPNAEKALTDFAQFFMTETEVQEIFDTEGVDKKYKPYAFVLEYVSANVESDKFGVSGTVTFNEFNKTIIAGDTDIDDDDQDGIILSSKYLSALGFATPEEAVGKTVLVGFKDVSEQVVEEKFIIRGVLEPGLFDSTLNFSEAGAKRISDLQKAGLPDAFNEVFVSKAEGISEEQFKQNLLDKGYNAQSIKDAIGTLNGIIDAMQISLGAFSGIAIIAAIVGVVNTLFMSVLERTKEIGLLRSLGASKRTIFSMFTFEALLIGFWGSVIGLIFANLAALVINRIAANTFLSGIDNFQLLGITWQLHVLIIVSISIISLLAGLLPAFKAARLNPIEALKYE